MLVLLAALATGCSSPSLVARAIRARGGPLAGVVRQVEGRVYAGFPGTWRWRTVFLVPDRYAWTIFTAGEPDHYLFDGTTVRVFVGAREATEEPGEASPLRTHARFTAVVNLDALLLPGVRVSPLAPGDLPPGAAAGLDVVLAGDGSRYRLGFDARDLLVHAEGPLILPPFGRGDVGARFEDFRPTQGRLLPYRTTYVFGGAPLADERTLSVCVDDPTLTTESFRSPAGLPDCAGPPSAQRPY